MAIFGVIITDGSSAFSWWDVADYAKDNFAILESEISGARGSCASTGARLGVTLNQDGTQIVASATGVDFSTTGYAAARVDADTFKVTDPATDLTAILSPGRVVRFNNDGTALYATIKASSFAAAETTVDIFNTNVPATITQLDIGIVHFGDAGSVISVEPISTKPAYATKYAGRLLYAVDTGVLWFGNALSAAFVMIGGGGMIYKDWLNSAAKGGTGVTVTQVGGAVTTRLDFNTPTRLVGRIISFICTGTNRTADSSTDFDVGIYTSSTCNADECIAKWEGLNSAVSPYGVEDTVAGYGFRNDDGTITDSLWVKITNNTTGDTSVFDIEMIVEALQEG